MRPFGAIIFDMDGVIVNSEPLHERAFYDVVEELGYGQSHGMRFADYIGRSDFELWQDFVAKHSPPHALADLLEWKRNRVIAAMRQHQPVFEGLPELLTSLATIYPLGLASGSERPVIEAVLDLRDLRRFFSAVVSAGEVPRGKPEPDIFLKTASLLGVQPETCCVIEDSRPGVAAALAAGMKVVAITNTHSAEELAAAQCVARTYSEIGLWLAGGAGG